jgi:UDP-N-acetylglucosamine--N-acetylmuramyl-(pentapeptide) pyrophosphoryl-undecaprenol N-acetylglucosamine transferase
MAFFFALRLLKEKKIDLLLAFGGFTSFVFVVAAKLRRIPVIIHESNIIPGKANRLAAPLADKIFLPEGASFRHCLSLRYCSHRKRIQYMGFPIRQEFEAMTKADARAQLGWPPLKKIILIIGGSSGALSLNKWIQQNFIRFAHHNIDIFCIAGPEFSEEKEVTFEDCTLHMLPFCEHMNLLIRACDLVIARGGAGTIGECQFCKKPMILIPHPSDAHSHQLANARQAEQLGIANIIEQSELDHLPSQAIEILSNSPILGAMQRSLEKAFVPDVAERIAGEVEHLLQSKKRKTKK